MADEWAEFSPKSPASPSKSADEWGEFMPSEGTTQPPAGDGDFISKASNFVSNLAPDGTSDFLAKTASNVGPSAVQFGKDLIYPFTHPAETAKTAVNLGSALSPMGRIKSVISGKEDPQVEAIMGHFAERYGGMDNLKKTISEDPVGFVSDLSTVLTGGGTLAAKVPGMVGKAGALAADVGKAIDPVNAAGKAVTAVGKGAAEVIGNIGTHTGGESIKQAARAGYEGGDAGKVFRDNMRGREPMEEAVNAATTGVENIIKERGDAYKQAMANLGLNNKVLDFNAIDAAVQRVAGIKNFKGISLSPKTAEVWDDINNAINDWRRLPPGQFHTPVGMDALKQKLGEIHQFYKAQSHAATPASAVASQVYNAVRNTIAKEVPEYAKIMRGYEEASGLVRELEKTLSLNPTATIDTSLRKLQSVLRNNVNTSYGRRKELADYLVNAGAPHLMERLAGQSLNSWAPRGLGKLGMQLAATIAGGAAIGGVHGLGAIAGALPFMSPRAMGEAAHLVGRAASPAKQLKGLTNPAFQAGRASRVASDKEEPVDDKKYSRERVYGAARRAIEEAP